MGPIRQPSDRRCAQTQAPPPSATPPDADGAEFAVPVRDGGHALRRPNRSLPRVALRVGTAGFDQARPHRWTIRQGQVTKHKSRGMLRARVEGRHSPAAHQPGLQAALRRYAVVPSRRLSALRRQKRRTGNAAARPLPDVAVAPVAAQLTQQIQRDHVRQDIDAAVLLGRALDTDWSQRRGGPAPQAPPARCVELRGLVCSRRRCTTEAWPLSAAPSHTSA